MLDVLRLNRHRLGTTTALLPDSFPPSDSDSSGDSDGRLGHEALHAITSTLRLVLRAADHDLSIRVLQLWGANAYDTRHPAKGEGPGKTVHKRGRI